MSGVDVTVVVTAHDETVVSGPSMRAADDAVDAARAGGLSVQTVVALDAATSATRDYFHQARFDRWEKRPSDVRDRGLVKNAVVADTSGRYLTFLDADGLVSENWLLSGVTELDRRAEFGERAIGHPELRLIFDAERSVVVNAAQDSALFASHQLYVRNTFAGPGLVPREAHLDCPYPPSDLVDDIGSADWHFAVRTMSLGWRHVIVPDTIAGTRLTDVAVATGEDPARRVLPALPEMTIDRIRTLGASR